MPRIARVVVPNYPHHVTQRGNRRQTTFFSDDDYRLYVHLISEARKKAHVEILAYCLMPNHVHFVAVPKSEDGLRKLFQEAHRRYTTYINKRENWRGHLWQQRFHSCAMDERHLMAAVRYIELNPVRANLCRHPAEWRWSSVHAHLHGEDDEIVTVDPMRQRVTDWPSYLATDHANVEQGIFSEHARTGRPLGSSDFITQLEALTGRQLRKRGQSTF